MKQNAPYSPYRDANNFQHPTPYREPEIEKPENVQTAEDQQQENLLTVLTIIVIAAVLGQFAWIIRTGGLDLLIASIDSFIIEFAIIFIAIRADGIYKKLK